MSEDPMSGLSERRQAPRRLPGVKQAIYLGAVRSRKAKHDGLPAAGEEELLEWYGDPERDDNSHGSGTCSV
jgi:hypothetical protein